MEKYHRSLKQNACIASPTRRPRMQTNHFVALVVGVYEIGNGKGFLMLYVYPVRLVAPSAYHERPRFIQQNRYGIDDECQSRYPS